MPKKFLDAFFRNGNLKIGTLYDYRKLEHYGEVIGDKNEGLHKTEFSFVGGGGEIDLATDTPEAAFFRTHVLRPDQQNSKVKIVFEDGARLIVENNSQDLYIYCLTSEYKPQVMKQFGCDGYIEIINPEAFFSAISHRIRHRGKFDGCGAVQYMRKDTHYTSPHRVHPAIMKDPEFSYQEEWRAIWIPHKQPKHSLFVDVPKAVRHCRVYAP